MTTQLTHTQLGIKQYNKDIPPGWRPGAYPISEYEEYIKVWLRITPLDDDKKGAVIFSRMELGALDLARRFSTKRWDNVSKTERKVEGLDALCAADQAEVRDSAGGTAFSTAKPAGYLEFIQKLISEFKTEDQDKAWIALDPVFILDGHNLDFFEYEQRFNTRYEQAKKLAGLDVGQVGLAYLFWSKAGIDDRTLADLRLKVDGKLDRYGEMTKNIK